MARPDRECPVKGCTTLIPRSLAMCRPHWHRVPSEIQKRIWREYRQRPGSAEHLQALEDATAAVDRREPEQLFE